MEIVINIDSNKFEEVVQKELDAFSKQELQELCRKGILNCLSNPETFKQLFINENTYYGNSAKEILKEAAKTINFEQLFIEVQNKIIDYVRENNKDIINDIMMQIFMNGMNQYLYNNDNFRSNLSAEIYNMTPHNQ